MLQFHMHLRYLEHLGHMEYLGHWIISDTIGHLSHYIHIGQIEIFTTNLLFRPSILSSICMTFELSGWSTCFSLCLQVL